MKNNSNFKKNAAPIIVLVSICLVVTAALAATFGVADPVIKANAIKKATETRKELLSKADKFTKYDGKLWKSQDGKAHVEDAYVADNKAGVVMTVVTKSFGGDLTEMIGIGKDGKITGVKVTNASDTPGLGTKAQAEGHLVQYIGLTEIYEISCKDDKQVKHITGATISSNAVHYGVYAAMQQYKDMGGVK